MKCSLKQSPVNLLLYFYGINKPEKLTPYFGIILIGSINNIQAVAAFDESAKIIFNPLSDDNVRFVHYPDCQQLIIWLTHPGIAYGNLRLKNNTTGIIAEECPVQEKLSGSIQLLWDTLPIATGSYTIEIDYKDGWQHTIEIEKLAEGIAPVLKETEPLAGEKENQEREPIIYKDGFGNILENEDLVLREKVHKDIARKFTRHLEYKGNFRSGTIIYIDNEVRIEFYHEMGGGNCMFYIDIPSEDQWEATTKTPISERKDIIEFVAARVKSEQASNCNYIIDKASIGFYYQ